MYENLHRINPETGTTVIDISLDDYMDFFHEWDNASFKKRGMHPELAEFLDRCSEDIPIKKKIEIIFFVENESKDENKEKLILESYKNHYAFYDRTVKKKIKALFLTAFYMTFISACFIFSHEILSKNLSGTTWTDVFLEGLMVGGWVFLWEAIHFLTFERRDYFHRSKELKRFLQAPIIFNYKENRL
jgi:hypothetical protein